MITIFHNAKSSATYGKPDLLKGGIRMVIKMKKFIVWRWMLPLARLIDKDKDDEEESYMERVKKHIKEQSHE
jgi:hypothetical protein